MNLSTNRKRSLLIISPLPLHYRNLLKVFGFSSVIFLSACATIEQATEVGEPRTYSYTHPSQSGLRVRNPFPNPDDVCVSLYTNSMIKPFESNGHFLIACPKHEIGAIGDRKVKQKAQIVGNAKHWVVMRVPINPETSI